MAEPITGKYGFDAAAREAQVIGSGPRFAPLAPGEVTPEGQAQIEMVRQAFNVPEDRDLPDVSLITLRHPGMFKGQMVLAIELAAHGALPPRDRELAILRLALLVRAPFEWSEHVDIGKAFGLTPADIERVILGSEAEGWSPHEAALLRSVEEMIADHCIADATWDILASTYSEKQMLELPMLVGAYVATAIQQNTLRIQPRAGFEHR